MHFYGCEESPTLFRDPPCQIDRDEFVSGVLNSKEDTTAFQDLMAEVLRDAEVKGKSSASSDVSESEWTSFRAKKVGISFFNWNRANSDKLFCSTPRV